VSVRPPTRRAAGRRSGDRWTGCRSGASGMAAQPPLLVGPRVWSRCSPDRSAHPRGPDESSQPALNGGPFRRSLELPSKIGGVT
jgi:hypothetical protein